LALVVATCQPPPPPGGAGTFPLEITVLDAADNTPLIGVMVVESHHDRRGFTDGDGICRLRLPDGKDPVEISLSLRDYWPAEVTRPAAVPYQQGIGAVVYLQRREETWQEDIGKSRRELRSSDSYAEAVILAVPPDSLPYPARVRVSRLAAACAWNTPFPEMALRGTPVGAFTLEMDPVTAPFRVPWQATLGVLDGHAGSLAANLPLELWSFDRERKVWQREHTALSFRWSGGGQGLLTADIDHPGLYVFFAIDAPRSAEDSGHFSRIGFEPMVAGEGRLLPDPVPARVTQEVFLTEGISDLPAVRTALQLRGFVFARWEGSTPVYRHEVPMVAALPMTGEGMSAADTGSRSPAYECGQYLVIDELARLTVPNEQAFLRLRITNLFLLQGMSFGSGPAIGLKEDGN